ncbi:PLC-like phosphodiesterase, partial [Coemansia reversa NRRL 1564]
CNGHVELCDRAYNEVSFACTHNSYAYPPPKGLPVLNQDKTISEQLSDGVRAFINLLNSVHLCHTSCALIDKGKLVDTLKVIKEFMDANPREVITLIIENVSGFAPKDLSPSFEESEIDKYAFKPEFKPNKEHNGYAWPTLESMIDKDERLVVFIDDKANTNEVAYILPEWEYIVEIPYANVNPVEKFPCNQDRPRDSIPRDLIVMNHFAYNRLTIGKENIDTPITAYQVKKHGYNSIDSLNAHWETCKGVWDKRVLNFITLDYYDVGGDDLFKFVNQVNGV